MKIYRYILILLLVCAALLVSCAPKQDGITMGTNATFPPFEFIGGANGDEVVGFDVDIAKEIAKRAGKNLVIEDTEFDSLLPALQSNKVDFVIAGMTITPERAQSVDFSDPYYEATQVVITHADDNRFKTTADLQNVAVAVQLGTTGEEVAKSYTNDIVAFNSGFEATSELLARRVDVVIIDEEPAKNYVRRQEGLKIIGMNFDPEYYGIAVKKGNEELLNIINDTLAGLKRTDEYDRLIEKHIAH